MDRYVVIGNPVAHSLSPEIHARFAQSTGEPVDYQRLLVPEGDFARHARAFFDAGGLGANVTLPFKLDAFEWADVRSERATLAGAANFLARRGARIEADNTDGVGLVADLTCNLGLAIEGRRVLLLGAGGAARGVLGPLLVERPARVAIANRTFGRAAELARRFSPRGPVEAIPLEAIAGERADLVVNATSSSTKGEALELPAGLLHPGVFAYDMAYGAAAARFVRGAIAAGARAADGLGMLVEQAAESFFLWRGKRPQTRAILDELRKRFA